jgi:hypothetical protein
VSGSPPADSWDRSGGWPVVAGIAAAGIGAAAAVGIDFAKAAADDEQAAASLANVLKQTAHATDAQVAAAEDWITTTSKSVAVADDELRPALQRLAGATGDTGKAQTLLQSALDISAGTGKDLGTVVEALTKAQMGNVGGLSRLGLATEDMTGRQLSLDQILAQSQTSFGGLAEAAANTASGGMAKAQIAMGEMKEQIGAFLLPMLGELGKFMTETVMPAVQSLIDYIKVHWPEIKAAIEPIMTSIRDLIASVVEGIRAIFEGPFGKVLIGIVMSTFNTLKAVIEPALRVIKGIIDVFTGLLSGDWSKVWNGIKDVVTGIWDAVIALLKGTWDRVKLVFGGLADLITAPFRAAFNMIADLWNKTIGALSFRIPDWVPGVGGKGWDVPDVPTWGARSMAAGAVVVNLPVGTDPYSTVTTLNTYTARAPARSEPPP